MSWVFTSPLHLENSRDNACEKRQIFIEDYSVLGLTVHLFVKRYFKFSNCMYLSPHLTLNLYSLLTVSSWKEGTIWILSTIPWVDEWIFCPLLFTTTKNFYYHLNVLFKHVICSLIFSLFPLVVRSLASGHWELESIDSGILFSRNCSHSIITYQEPTICTIQLIC